MTRWRGKPAATLTGMCPPEGGRYKNDSANHPVLIANETRSREESSGYKQRSYEFLIANEFHVQTAPQKRHLRMLEEPTQFSRRALLASGLATRGF